MHDEAKLFLDRALGFDIRKLIEKKVDEDFTMQKCSMCNYNVLTCVSVTGIRQGMSWVYEYGRIHTSFGRLEPEYCDYAVDLYGTSGIYLGPDVPKHLRIDNQVFANKCNQMSMNRWYKLIIEPFDGTQTVLCIECFLKMYKMKKYWKLFKKKILVET